MDISNPANPTIAGYYEPSGCFALGVESQNGYVYIADGIAGFQIYRNLLVTPVSVEPENEYILNNFKLEQNYPNPFNPTTKIIFTVPYVIASGARQSELVTLKIYDILGREISTLVNEEKPGGEYEVEFSAIGGSASGGNAYNLPSGIYFYQIKVGNYSETKKMILLR